MKLLVMVIGLLIIGALSVSSASAQPPAITTFGEGKVTVPADGTIISVAVASNNTNATVASEEIAEQLNKTKRALIETGVKEEDFQSGTSTNLISGRQSSRICRQFNNTTVCENISSNVNLMTRSMTVLVQTADRSKVDEVIDAAVSSGASAEVAGYILKNSSKARDDAKVMAKEDAERRARAEANLWGLKLGRVLEISDCGLYDYGMGFMTGMGLDDLFLQEASEPGTVDVTACVEVTYETSPM